MQQLIMLPPLTTSWQQGDICVIFHSSFLSSRGYSHSCLYETHDRSDNAQSIRVARKSTFHGNDQVQNSELLYSLELDEFTIGIWQYRLVSCQLFNIEGATCPRTYMVYIYHNGAHFTTEH
jgi:hypothetical protein